MKNYKQKTRGKQDTPESEECDKCQSEYNRGLEDGLEKGEDLARGERKWYGE